MIPTLQADPHFGRAYAAYGGAFIVLSLLWGGLFDGFQADRWDVLGAAICLLGVLVMFLRPAGPVGRLQFDAMLLDVQA